jgi:hypothetical protein
VKEKLNALIVKKKVLKAPQHINAMLNAIKMAQDMSLVMERKDISVQLIAKSKY